MARRSIASGHQGWGDKLFEWERTFVPSPRQQEILDLLVKGLSDKEIAEALGTSIGTVRTHLSRLYKAWRLGGRVSAAVAWVELLRKRAPDSRFEAVGSVAASSTSRSNQPN